MLTLTHGINWNCSKLIMHPIKLRQKFAFDCSKYSGAYAEKYEAKCFKWSFALQTVLMHLVGSKCIALCITSSIYKTVALISCWTFLLLHRRYPSIALACMRGEFSRDEISRAFRWQWPKFDLLCMQTFVPYESKFVFSSPSINSHFDSKLTIDLSASN